VGGSLIDLSLPIAAVYTRVWQAGDGGRGGQRRGGPGGAMAVTFRLSGLDGEATEPVVKQLPAAAADGGSPEEQFAAAAVLSERGGAGLRLLLALLAARAPAARRAAPQLLKLLAAACAVRACRRGLLRVGALRALLHLVHAACRPLLDGDAGGAAAAPLSPRASGAAPSEAAGAAAEAAAQLGGGWSQAQLLELLKMLESLANEADAPVDDSEAAPAAEGGAPTAVAGAQDTPGGTGAAEAAAAAAAEAEDVAVDACQLGRGLTLLERHGLGDCGAVLARVLTALARSDAAAQRGLLDHFAPALDLDSLDAAGRGGAEEQRLQLQGLLKLTEALTAVPGAGEGCGGGATESSEGGGGATAAAPAGGAEGAAADCGFRQLVLERGIPGQLAGYLVECFAAPPAPPPAASDAGRSPAPSDSGGVAIPGGGGRGGEEEEDEEGHHDEWMFGASPAPGGGSPKTPRLLRLRATPSPTPPPAGATRGARGSMPGAEGAGSSGGGAPRLADPSSAVWRAAAARPGVAFALQLLAALARGHVGVSRVLAGAPLLLELAHALEGVHGGRELAPLAEGLLEVVSAAGGPEVSRRVGAMRGATRAAMRAVAARKREEMLAAMGMVQVRRRGGMGACGRMEACMGQHAAWGAQHGFIAPSSRARRPSPPLPHHRSPATAAPALPARHASRRAPAACRR
jgi:hypothetical protein